MALELHIDDGMMEEAVEEFLVWVMEVLIEGEDRLSEGYEVSYLGVLILGPRQ